jgi:hypothetical protein
VAIGLVTTVAVWPGALAAQVRDSSPTFDQLARRVLTLKVEVEWLRGRLDDRGSSAAGDGRTGWRPLAWTDSLEAIQPGLDVLGVDARRLRAAYQGARHDLGLKLATELIALVERAGASFNSVVRARDERSARAAITHLTAGLDALIQKIGEGEACCKAALR